MKGKKKENYLAIRGNGLRKEFSTEEAFEMGLKRQDVDACRKRESILNRKEFHSNEQKTMWGNRGNV